VFNAFRAGVLKLIFFGVFAMTHLRGEIRLHRDQHRLFPHMLSLSTLVSAIAISSNVIANGNMVLTVGYNASFESVQFPLYAKLPIWGPIQLALQGVEPNSTVVGLDPSPTWRPGIGGPHHGMAKASLHAINPIYVEFYEQYKEWLTENIGSNTHEWPTPWAFARTVRNAIVHNRGVIHWDDPHKTSVKWHNLTYSHAENRRQIIGIDLSLADLVMLLLEMNEALDHAGCPT
jgi:hypothetical protein